MTIKRHHVKLVGCRPEIYTVPGIILDQTRLDQHPYYPLRLNDCLVANMTALEADRGYFFRNTRTPASKYPRSCNSHPRQLDMTENKRPPRSRELREHEFQRVYKACIPCARRKVKCQLVEGSKCARCSKKRLDCTFSTKKPWSREPKNTGNESIELPISNEGVQERFAVCLPYLRSVCLHSLVGCKAPLDKPRPNKVDFPHRCCRKLFQTTMML